MTPRTHKRRSRRRAGYTLIEVMMALGVLTAGSVGIIMSGWLGTANYGVIVSHAIDKYLDGLKRGEPADAVASNA